MPSTSAVKSRPAAFFKAEAAFSRRTFPRGHESFLRAFAAAAKAIIDATIPSKSWAKERPENEAARGLANSGDTVSRMSVPSGVFDSEIGDFRICLSDAIANLAVSDSQIQN